MKKKTKSKLSNDLAAPFWIAIIICVIAVAASSVFFVNNFTKTLSNLNEEPIATISFKYKTAQRRLLNRSIWDRLKQNSYLYNGDTIHTAEQSEATVKFNDGTQMVLMESTMAQIFLDEEKGAGADLMEGQASVDASEESAGFVLTYGSSYMNVNSGSSVTAKGNKDDDSFQVQVFKGDARVFNLSGDNKSLREGDTIEVSENQLTLPLLAVTSPKPNEKVVYHTQGNYDARFEWQTSNIPYGKKLLLEIAKDKKFSIMISSEDVSSVSRQDISLGEGSYYWRLRVADMESPDVIRDDDYSVASKIQIIQGLSPNLITPVEDYSYSYRSRNPAVRFTWSEVAGAQSYRLLVSKSQDMSSPVITQRVSSPSSVISTLNEGFYYWQVTPFFAVNGEGFAAPSQVNSFRVEKKSSLTSPVLFLPAQDSVVNIESHAKNTSFSWKMDEEASNYKLLIADNPSLTNPVFTAETANNYVSVKASSVLKEGNWYWGVSFVDFEGNQSPRSDVHTFYAMIGNPEQRTIEPAQDYMVSENLVMDLRFTWRKNLPAGFESTLEIARDSQFNDKVFVTAADEYNYSGVNLSSGDYYWRLHSVSKTDGMVLDTPAKHFTVVGNLARSNLIDLEDKAIVRDNKPFTFNWTPVDDADFYRVEIYRISTGELLYTDNVYDTKLNLDMYWGEGFVDKENYRIEIQARGNAIPGIVSRRTGYINERVFTLVKLKPVDIILPEKNAVIDGATAARNKITIQWNAVDEVRKAQIVLYRVEKNNQRTEVLRIPEDPEVPGTGRLVADRTVKINNPDLTDGGEFEIIVFAETLDGVDISNSDPSKVGRFILTPVEPLPAAQNLQASPEILDAEYLQNLSNPRSIHLSWDKVQYATEYVVQIQNRTDKVLYTTTTNTNSLDLMWLEVINAQKSKSDKDKLYEGTWWFIVEARNLIDTDGDGQLDTVLQEGKKAESSFRTAVPKPEKSKGKGAKNAFSTK